jgi:hypothetical protein
MCFSKLCVHKLALFYNNCPLWKIYLFIYLYAYFFVGGLFYSAVSISDYIASNVRMAGEQEYGRKWLCSNRCVIVE